MGPPFLSQAHWISNPIENDEITYPMIQEGESYIRKTNFLFVSKLNLNVKNIKYELCTYYLFDFLKM